MKSAPKAREAELAKIVRRRDQYLERHASKPSASALRLGYESTPINPAKKKGK